MKKFIFLSLIFLQSLAIHACNVLPPAPAPCSIVGSWENDIAFNEVCLSDQVQTFHRSGFAEQKVFFPECQGLDTSLWQELRLYSFFSYSHNPPQNEIIMDLLIQFHRDVTGDWDTLYGGNSVTVPIVYNLLGCDTMVVDAGVGWLDSLCRL
ncbi:MAG: hypothetical protein SF052_15750 [Bacteroidia bacterium]|nr:hypothetical protein [Bacteroidia bacterium]